MKTIVCLCCLAAVAIHTMRLMSDAQRPTPAPSPIAAYLAEARELAQRLGAIEPPEFKRRYDRTLELASAIRRQAPAATAVPPAAGGDEAAFAVVRIGFKFSLAQVLVNDRSRYLRLGLRARAREAHAKLRRIERELLDQIDRAEQLPRSLDSEARHPK